MIERGTEPWPKSNEERVVRLWFIIRIGSDVEEEERNPIAGLCLDYVSNMTKGERLMNSYKFPESQLDKLAIIAEKVSKGNPVQYVLGSINFDGLDLMVDSRVLIPRPETEELVYEVEKILSKGINAEDYSGNILDIGTGSGCIAIGLKKRLPNAKVYATDLSEKALEVAKGNSLKTNFKINFECSDLLISRPFRDIVFDTVVSNPPYIPEIEKKLMHKRVINFEPNDALFVPNDDFLLFYRRIIKLCGEGMLRDGGVIALECHEDYASDVVALLNTDTRGWQEVVTLLDLQGKTRHVIALLALT